VIVRYDLDQTNKELNSTKKEIGKILKVDESNLMVSHLQAKGDAKELLEKKAKLEGKQKQLQRDEDTTRESLENKVRKVGNIVDKSVPISKNEV
jgi:seryl-tRNA synthetase